MWFIPQNFIKLLVHYHEIFHTDVVRVEIFVDFETAIESKNEIANESQGSQSPFLVSLDMR